MSHLATVQTEIKDTKAVQALCDELGLTFHENKRTHRLYTTQAPCAHAISNSNKWGGYEIGLIGTPTGYTLSFDDMLQGCYGEHSIGKGASKLLQLYGVHKATMEARKLGYMVTRKAGANGAIKLTVSGM